MRYNKKEYLAHKCISCSQMTTNKTYCDRCMRLYVGIPYMPSKGLNIYADIDPSATKRTRRKENVTQLSEV